MIAWVTPVASTSAIAPTASVEKRPTVAASTRVRSAGSSSRVAPRSTSTSTAMPPSHALTASTWTTLAGALSHTGGCTPAWPPSAGRKASATSGGSSAAPGGTASAPISVASHANAPTAHTPPKRVESTASSTSGSSAAHTLVPPAVAPWRTTTRDGAEQPGDRGDDEQPPQPARERSRRRAADAEWRPRPQQEHRARRAPIAIAPYCTARTTANAVEVTGPASLPCSSSSTVFAGALASPTVNTKPPDTGCESAEMTR